MFGAIEGILSREGTVTVYRSTQTSGKGGVPEISPSSVVTGLRMRVENLSDLQRLEAYGLDSKAKWRGVTQADANIQDSDLIVPDDGPYKSTVMEVEGKPRLTSTGYPTITRAPLMVVALKETTKTV